MRDVRRLQGRGLTADEFRRFKRRRCLTASEIAVAMGVNIATVFRWLQAGTSARTDLALTAAVWPRRSAAHPLPALKAALDHEVRDLRTGLQRIKDVGIYAASHGEEVEGDG